MKAYRSFFICSLCAHILLLAYAETLMVSAPPRPRPIPVATIFEQAVPLPMGEPATGPPAGEPAGPPPAPEPVMIPPPPPALHTSPTPAKKVRKKPTPRPPREIATVEPPPASFPPLENQPMIESAATGDEAGGASDGHTSTAATASGGGTGSGQERGNGGGGGGGGGSLAKPDYGVNPKPPYPMLARRMGAEGIVTLRVFVHPDGSVGEVVVSRSSGFSILDDSALTTVRERWRFVPARLDGRPVESWVEVPIRFVLEKG